MKKKHSIYIVLPLIVSLFLVLGIFVGRELGRQKAQSLLFKKERIHEDDKLNQVISFIKSDYVDTVKEKTIMEETIQELLQNLDPHSYYIPGSQFSQLNDPLEGNFEGIGVEFRIVEDTVVIIQALGGGPSEKVGIMAGDRIVKVEGEDITGPAIGNQEVISRLKGPKGTEVKVKVLRKGEKELLEFEIIRDKIPFHSIEAAYMLDENTAYIKVLRFAKTTYDEFIEAAKAMRSQGMEDMIIDLRNNTGGLMSAAINMADEFLEKGRLIVYTRGKARKRVDYLATSDGMLENADLAILINEGSASASEILAGAIQDNDRGLIVGRRSFGKGLVQESVRWPDGSAIRLTVARYYTPSGRSIQKPYDEGIDKYNEEAYQRYLDGEMFSKDSIDFPDSLKFYTRKGKVVYGGGGITPDLFIGLDTNIRSSYYNKLNYRGIFYQFGFDYVDQYRPQLEEDYPASSFIDDFQLNKRILKEFHAFAAEKGIEKPEQELHPEIVKLINNRLKATIGRNYLGDQIFYRIFNREDPMVNRALEKLNQKSPLMSQRASN